MGQKINPIVLRLGIIRDWSSKWYADKAGFSKCVLEDYKIRKFIKERFKQAAIANIVIERLTEKVRLIIHSARPGIIIGRHGADIERLKEDLFKIIKKETVIDIEEISTPSLCAQLAAENIAFQIEKRVAHKKALKRSMDLALNSGAKGFRIKISGRLGGSEIARSELYKSGSIPLQTLRADIDYGFAEAFTTYGLIGIKVWIYKGDIIGQSQPQAQGQQGQEQTSPEKVEKQ